MYSLDTPLDTVNGIGPALSAALAEYDLHTVKDLLLFIPLRYEDRSSKKMIYQLQPGELVTIEAEVVSSRNFYKGRRSIQSATVKDHTARLQLMWFNNPHIVPRLQKGKKFFVSGKLNERGTMVQPTIEEVSDDTIHTNRLVPIYSTIKEIQPGKLRRILKNILENLNELDDHLKKIADAQAFPINDAFSQIHFPDTEEKIVEARERFAVEELLSLIHHSHQMKEAWKKGEKARDISPFANDLATRLPFTLTTAQQRCIQEILGDLHTTTPMNRLLIGDVGSGKTAVAGIACAQVLANGHSAVFVAPTQILAEQHYATFQKLFKDLPVHLVTAKTAKSKTQDAPTLTLYIGTHALLNRLDTIQPALIIYDEQHRFGVAQRSAAQHLSPRPHVLTLSATPIPRTLMLTLFSHLSLSMLDEMPPGRQPVKTLVVPEKKRSDAYGWISDQLQNSQKNGGKIQALFVCPFIDPSHAEALENVAAATEMFEKVQHAFAKNEKNDSGKTLNIELLHGRIPKNKQTEITRRLYDKEIDILVTTPIVEVGVDLPAATIIVIEAAERFGLASLHQMRGRVGRAGQEAYCLLFTNAKNTDSIERLKKFSTTHNGIELAQQDLQRRGAGDIFGFQQHGFDDLRFASWTNLELIARAQKIAEQLRQHDPDWQPFFTSFPNSTEDIPLAN